jgi:hypothetical protein
MKKGRDNRNSIKMKNPSCFEDIEKLARGEKADESQIEEILCFIDERFDCSDFRMICILRSLCKYTTLISQPTLERMKRSVLGFKYWMDEPGEDSMCYWSENHQILFAACEYIAGQLYPAEVFTNSGMTGAQHLKKAEEKINRWLERRWQFGFIEWHSNTYYEEDIAPLSLLIEFCADESIVQKAAILMDLFMLDLALHIYKGLFCATSGRCYEIQKQDPFKQDVRDIIEKAFSFGLVQGYSYNRLSTEFILNEKYIVPQEIYEIAHCEDGFEVKTSMGLDLTEIKTNFGCMDIDDAGMFMWAMEAFTNTHSVNLTIDIFRKWKLHTNEFLKDIKIIDIPLIRELNLLPLIIKLLNPATQGIAIQRANTCTYKTKHWMLSTAQNHHPQEFGDQQHIWQATLEGGISVFTTHPAVAFFDDKARSSSPSYWVGNGINPHSAQHKNMSLSLYDLRTRKGFLERSRPELTHAYFPFEKFDKVIFDKPNIVIGQKGGAYIALISLSPLEKKDNCELIQNGMITGWAAILGDVETYESLDSFSEYVNRCKLELAGRKLTLNAENVLEIEFKKGFVVDGKPVNTNYQRIESPFANVPRKPQTIDIDYKGAKLHLDFYNQVRKCE